MSVQYSEELPYAFVVRPDDLKKLVELLKCIGKVEVRADCEDKITRKFNTVKDLSDYENSNSKKIRRIHLSARSEDDYSKSATIYFGSYFGWWIVSITINGREDVVSRLKGDILEVLSGMRPWYSWIACANLFTIFAVGFCVLLSIFFISILLEWIPVSDSPSSTSNSVKASATVFLTVLATSLVLWDLTNSAVSCFQS